MSDFTLLLQRRAATFRPPNNHRVAARRRMRAAALRWRANRADREFAELHVSAAIAWREIAQRPAALQCAA